jgi:hypothetical protein
MESDRDFSNGVAEVGGLSEQEVPDWGEGGVASVTVV